ncbi:MAG: hypothetical protein NZ571_08555 [Anaerolineae bacterium]|nr:hypothetical protein [Anaerolineae bacterium]
MTRCVRELRPESNRLYSLSPAERVSWLTQCFHKLQPSNTEAHLKQIADLTFHSHQREAIRAALELLKAWRGTVDGSAYDLLFQMIRVFELSDGDVDLLLGG